MKIRQATWQLTHQHHDPAQVTLGEGLTLIVGENASGKTTLSRLLHGALWGDSIPSYITGSVEVEALGGERHSTRLWAGSFSPSLAEAHKFPSAASGAWLLDLSALIAAEKTSPDAVEKTFATAMRGGIRWPELGKVPQSRPPTSLAQALKQQEEALREVARSEEAVAEAERSLPALQTKLDASVAASQRQKGLLAKKEWLDAEQRLQDLNARQNRYPRWMKHLYQQDLASAQKTLAQLDGARGQLREVGVELRLCEQNLEALGVPVELSVTQISDLARQVEGALSRRDEAGRREKILRRRMTRTKKSGFFSPMGEVDGKQLDVIEHQIGKLREVQGRRDALHWASELPFLQKGSADHRRMDTLVLAQQRLIRWLGWTAVFQSQLRPWKQLMAVGLGAALAGICLVALSSAAQWAFLGATLILLGGAGAGIAAGYYRLSTVDPRPSLQQEHEAEGLGVPSKWSRREVEGSVGDLRSLMRGEGERLGLGTLSQHLSESAQQCAGDFRKAQTAFYRSIEGWGLDESYPDHQLVLRARLWSQYVVLRAEYLSVQAEVEVAEEGLQQVLTQVRALFGRVGLNMAEEAAEACIRQLQDLSRRVEDATALRGDLGRLEDSRLRFLEEISAGEGRLAEQASRLSVELDQLLPLLEQWHPAYDDYLTDSGAVRSLEAELETLRGRHGCSEAPTPQWVQAELRSIQDELEDLQPLLSSREEMMAEMKYAQKVIREALATTARERVTEGLQQSREALREQARARVQRLARRLLLQRADERYTRSHSPKLFQRARSWFQEFTQGQFVLDFQGERLQAVRTKDGERLKLWQLSGATQAQLWIAVRLAYLEHVEHPSSPIPVLLDEALATTDPHRFEVVATALGVVAKEGRQVIVLSSSPADIARWRQVIPDLTVSRLSRRTAVGTALAEDSVKTLKTLEDRGQAFNVPHFSVPAQSWPIWTLLSDHDDVLERCLGRGVEDVGALCIGVESSTHEAHGLRDLIQRRAEILSKFVEVRSRGRARKVPWSALEDAEVLTPAMTAPLRRVWDKTSHDGDLFLSEVNSVKNFRRRSREKLQRVLEERELLRTVEPVPESSWIGEVVKRVGPDTLEPRDEAFIRRLASLVILSQVVSEG